MAPILLPQTDDLSQLTAICTLPPGSFCRRHSRDAFHQLVSSMNQILGPSSGIDSSDVSVADLISSMESYISQEADWAAYAHADLSRNYTRNFVDHGNGKANLLILVWSPGKGSLVHDHAGAHCIMKVLKGALRETLYELPTGPVAEPLEVRRDSVYGTDKVTYISDDIGLHKIENASSTEIAVSLHLYTPPWAEKNGCYCFDEKSGKRTRVEMHNYYSVYGKVKPLKVRSC